MLLVLGGGTLLAAQVQGDLDAGVQDIQADLKGPGDTAPLKLNEFKLPKDVPLEIPEGASISPDLSKLTLPEDIELDLPDDLDLSNLDFKLPEDFDLSLPEGSVFTPTGLDLPNGGTIRLPDGREFKLPAGSHLDIPPALAEQLRRGGLPTGTLPAGYTIPVRDLPAGTSAQLDPPQFTGEGNLRLPAGTTITLPDGQRFPFPAGLLAAAAQYLLPAGTTFDIPFDAEGTAGGTFPVPVPDSPTQLAGARPATTSRAIAVSTEITEMPTRVRKGDPVVVGGYVRETSSGRPVVGAPVDVFLNETKRTAGILVGSGVSDSRGNFRITLDIPQDKPASNWQLVNHAAAFVDATGRVYADGWGDPPFSTYASTSLTLEVPARDGFGSRTPIAGTLVDHTGAAVSGLTVSIWVDGAAVAFPTTSTTGRYATAYTFPVGTHTVEARFTGTANYEAASPARATISIADHTLELASTVRARPGDALVLTGRLLDQGAGMPSRTVQVSGFPFGAATLEAVTDATGRFSYSTEVPLSQAPGAYTLTYRVADIDLTKTQRLEVNESGRLSVTAPTAWDVDVPMKVELTLLTNDTGRALADQPVRLTLAGPGGSRDMTLRTDAAGRISTTLSPLRNTTGAYTLTARFAGSPHLQVSGVTSSVSLGLFEVAWDAPASVVRGDILTLAGTVRFGGKPFAFEELKLDAFGSQAPTTDSAGRFSWTGRVPVAEEPGPMTFTLTATDHPARMTNVTILAVTKIHIDAPEAFTAGEPVELGFLLDDDKGEPLRESRITLTAVGPAGVTRTFVTTDKEGRWKGPLNLSAEEGNVTLSARYESDGPYLGSDSTQVMSATAPVVKGPMSPLVWIIPLGAVLLAGAGGAGYYAWRRTRTRAVPVVAAVAAPIAAPVVRAADFDVRFGIPADEPAVWGVNEPLELTLANRGAPGEIELAWPGGWRRVPLGPDAQVRTTLTFPAEGDVTITARRLGASDVEPASATVRIVDYPKETAREFDLFLAKAKNLEASLDKRSTPREIQWALSRHLGGEAEQKLEEIALVMELTNYSHHHTARPHYLRFVRASRALDPFFAPRAVPRPPSPPQES